MSAFISVVPVVGAAAGAFCIGVVAFGQFVVVVAAVPLVAGGCVVVVVVLLGVVGVPEVVGAAGVVEDVVVLPLVVAVVADVPGGQLGTVVFVVAG